MTITVTTASGITDKLNNTISQSNWDAPEHLAISQREMHRFFPTIALQTTKTIALPYATEQLDIDKLPFADPLCAKRTIDGQTFLNRRLYNDALMIIHKNKVIHESYRNGMRNDDKHVIHSCSKSLISLLIHMAVSEGRVEPTKRIRHYLPTLSDSVWEDVSVQHVWDMQAGIAYSENYSDPNADYWSYAQAAGYYPTSDGRAAIGIEAWIQQELKQKQYPAGHAFVYNSTLTNVLGMLLQTVYAQALTSIIEQKLYSKIGAEDDAYCNTDALGFPIVEGQISMRLSDFSRIANVLLNSGETLAGDIITQPDFATMLCEPDENLQRIYQQDEPDRIFPCAQYQKQFWVLEPQMQRFCMLGIHGQFAWYDLKNELLITGFGSYPKQDGELMMSTLKNLWNTLSATVST